jgi:hypothetical protein
VLQPPGSSTLQVVADTELSQDPHAVRLDRDSGAHLSERGSLLVETNVNASLEESRGSRYATDPAADHSYAKWAVHDPCSLYKLA